MDPIERQQLWARSRRFRAPMDRLVLYELVLMSAGYQRVDVSPELLSGLVGLDTGRVRGALDRLHKAGHIVLEERDGVCAVNLRTGAADPGTSDTGGNA